MHISNADLRSEILYYQYQLGCWRNKLKACPRSRRPKPRASENLGLMIYTLCQKLAERPNFAGYTFVEDMVQAASMDCLLACTKFNPVSTTSAFAYLTTTAWRRMTREIERERKWHAIPLAEGVNTPEWPTHHNASA